MHILFLNIGDVFLSFVIVLISKFVFCNHFIQAYPFTFSDYSIKRCEASEQHAVSMIKTVQLNN
jgi:hypothetical protein